MDRLESFNLTIVSGLVEQDITNNPKIIMIFFILIDL